ncbi:MAG: hypothetical protein Q7K45_01190, partial [Nanoarchaeota archaeon]|nr:hypothetical protein [Nanoarchaeota archaeon]
DETTPQHHRELRLSFSHDSNPSLEPLMLVHNAHTLESVLNESLWRLEPSTFLGRAALLGAAFYEQAVFNAGAHELAHYQESREAGRAILEFPLWRVLIFQGHVKHSRERGREGVVEDMSNFGRGLAVNTLLANNILQNAVLTGSMHTLDGLNYVVNHIFVSMPVYDKKNYEILAEKLQDSSQVQNLHRNIIGISLFNALDPYTLYSAWGIGKYVFTGNSRQNLPSPLIPQLNGYLAVPQPLYEACWYVPWQSGVLSAALRGGNAVENTVALRTGIEDFPFGRKISLTAMLEGIHSGNHNDGVAHAKILFQIAGIKAGPTFSYTSGGWSPLVNGLAERYLAGIGLQL